MSKPFNPLRDRPEAVDAFLEAMAEGASVKAAAGAAGVHRGTVYRWMLASPMLARALEEVVEEHRRAHRLAFLATPSWLSQRPRVPVHPECPECFSDVEVRRADDPRVGFAFWRCSRWPRCGWASWRPRHPGNCPECGEPRFYSHSRLSVSCEECGSRWWRE